MFDPEIYQKLLSGQCPNCGTLHAWDFYDLGLNAAAYDRAVQCMKCNAAYGIKAKTAERIP